MLKKLATIILGAVLLLTAAAAPAQAGSNFGIVTNQAGARIWVDCSLGKAPHTDHVLYEYSKTHSHYRSKQYKDCSDADAFQVRYDKRCIEIIFPYGAPKFAKANPGRWYKLPGLHQAVGLPYNRCGRWAPDLGVYLQRLT